MPKVNETSNKPKRKYHVPAVDIAFKILKLLSGRKFSNSNLTEISNALSLTPTTCYRVLQQLQELAIVRYDPRAKRYSLGPYLLVLGERAKENLFDISIIIPFLEELSARTGLTSALLNKVGSDRSVVVAKVEGGDFGINVTVGKHFSIIDGAHGKCFLAYMEEEEADELIRTEEGLRKLDEKDIEELKKELVQVKEDGYAITFGEYMNGLFGVASPIFNFDKKVDMVICLYGVTAQFSKEDLVKKGEIVKEVASELSKKINGYSD